MLPYILQRFLILFSASSSDQEMSMTVPQLIQWWGYPIESHEVTTKDGYILTIFRIAHGFNQSALILANAGFDVFLMNHRGTTYSRKHRDFNTTDARFWKFTMDEHAKYDNLAVIDYILEETRENSLYWLGHSQGALLGFMMLSNRPDYNDKIRAMFQVAPPGTAHYAKGFWRFVFFIYRIFKPFHDFYRISIGSHEVGMANRLIPQIITRIFCATPFINQICQISMHFGLGKPAPTFNLLSIRKRLEHFDHNPIENMARYGQMAAPAYNLSNVNSPIHIFWGSNDWLATIKDVEEDILPLLNKETIKGIYSVDNYNHLDFVLATDNAEKVFNTVIRVVKEQEKDMCD